MLPLAAAVAVLGLIIAGGKMALTRKANPLIDVGSGLVIIAATSAVGVLLPDAAAAGRGRLVELGAERLDRRPVRRPADHPAQP